MQATRTRRALCGAGLTVLLALGCASAAGTAAHAPDCVGAACATGHLNVAVGTLGGRQFWADVAWDRGWRIQRHVWTGHHRVLDPTDVRRAWGALDDCERRFACARAGLPEAPPEHLVLLVHGLGRTRFSLDALAAELRADGGDVACIAYPSTRGSIEAHADSLRSVIEHLRGVRRVSFVTHSLGGVVVRELLGRDEPWPAALGIEVERVAMLAPPNQRVELAQRLAGNPLFRWLAGPAGQQLARGEQELDPPPPVPTLVIAGGGRDGRGYNPFIAGDDDGIVAVHETVLAGAAFRRVRGLHTFLMNDPEVRAAVRAFLKSRGGP